MRRLAWIGLAAALALSPAAGATAAPHVITQPDWQRKPGGEEMANAYPTIARDLGIDGNAILSCEVNFAGVLINCRIEGETPKGLGFGAAALSMADAFRMRPMTFDGQPVDGGTVRIPIMFRMPPPRGAWAAPTPTSPQALTVARQLAATVHPESGFQEYADRNARQIELAPDQGAPAEADTAAGQALREAAQAEGPAIREAFARIFAAHFTADELKSIAGFMDSPAGAATAGQSETSRTVISLIQREFIRRVIESARDQFCASHDCSAEATTDAASDVQLPDPVWAEQPSEDDIERVRPPFTYAMRIPGYVRMNCVVAELGLLHNCKVAREVPTDLGFGSAALSLSGYFKLPSGDVSESAQGKVAAVRVRFPAPEPPQPTEPPPPRSPHSMALAQALLAERPLPEVDPRVLIAQLEQFLSHGGFGVAPGNAAVMKPILMSAISRTLPQANAAAAAYLTHELSDEQLEAAAAFWKTPAGQAWWRSSADIAQAWTAASQVFSDAITARAGDAFCAQRGCRRTLPATLEVKPQGE